MLQPQDISNLRASRDAALVSAMAAEERVRILDAAIDQAARQRRKDDLLRLQAERAVASRRAAAGRLRLRAARRRRVCRAQGVAHAAAGGDRQQLQRPVAVRAGARADRNVLRAVADGTHAAGAVLPRRHQPGAAGGGRLGRRARAGRGVLESQSGVASCRRGPGGARRLRRGVDGAGDAGGSVPRRLCRARDDAGESRGCARRSPVHRSTASDPACHRACRSPPGSVRRARLHDGSGDPHAA